MAERKDRNSSHSKPAPFTYLQSNSTKPKKILKEIYRSEDQDFTLPVRKLPSKPAPIKMQVFIAPKEWIEPQISEEPKAPEQAPDLPISAQEDNRESVEMDIDLPRPFSPFPDDTLCTFQPNFPMKSPQLEERSPEIPLIDSIFRRKRSRSPRKEVPVPRIPIQVKRQVVEDQDDDMFAKTPIDEDVTEADPVYR